MAQWADILVDILSKRYARQEFSNVPPKMDGRFRIGLPKMHGRFRIGPPGWYICFRMLSIE